MARPAVSDDVFRAIADRTRRRIVELLAQRPHSPSELAAEYDSCQSTISEHLGVLRRGVGLARFEDTAGRRTYYANLSALDEVADCVDALQEQR
ncbi:metalloregulator ArsR/SmtB family transcription factor [Streptomyces sp. NBC_00201]|uniref:ArsR/SmtB family transcription factor n=1 Tax=Streptomyces sp. NBC_00201 TaxID=2975679 RepID=UPI002251014F|nr:metalloregulator ArsR/SmtB family transcription factor [Streptomyces sp. NBC_00201]MCX5247122.1 metalloregulator ArsR/SmtB family transcription factor [Streptomyces sp. NBC_00201]